MGDTPLGSATTASSSSRVRVFRCIGSVPTNISTNASSAHSKRAGSQGPQSGIRGRGGEHRGIVAGKNRSEEATDSRGTGHVIAPPTICHVPTEPKGATWYLRAPARQSDTELGYRGGNHRRSAGCAHGAHETMIRSAGRFDSTKDGLPAPSFSTASRSSRNFRFPVTSAISRSP